MKQFHTQLLMHWKVKDQKLKVLHGAERTHTVILVRTFFLLQTKFTMFHVLASSIHLCEIFPK